MLKQQKKGRPPPRWLHSLSSRWYCVSEIVPISGTTTSNIKIVMGRYADEVLYIPTQGRVMVFYKWDKASFLDRIRCPNGEL
jgi:hypothetical protein